MKRKARKKTKPSTQNAKLVKLLAKKPMTRDQIAKALGVNPASVGGYIFDIKRLYGAKVEFSWEGGLYTLKKRVKLPKEQR